MSFDTQNYIELFYQDADEHLQLMTDALLDLERNPADKEALAAVFRSAHTMKSSSAMVGFMHISEFTHKMEDLIGYLRDNNVTINTETVDVLFKAFDVLKEMLTQLQDEATEAHRNETKKHAKDLMGVFHTMLTGEETEPEAPVASEEPSRNVRIRMNEEVRNRLEELRLAGDTIHEITILFCKDVQMAGTRAFLIANNLAKLGTVVKTEPDLDDDAQTIQFEFAIVLATKHAESEIRKYSEVSEVEKVIIRDVTQIDQFEWPNEADAAHPSATPAADAAAVPPPAASGSTEPVSVKESVAKTEPGAEPETEGAKDVLTSFDRREEKSKVQTVRVSIEKLDRLLNLAAEMVIQRGRVYELSQQLVLRNGKGGLEEEILDAINQQGMFLSQLQETIMESRMVPIGMVFSRFRRVVRDLAHARGKTVNLVLEGEETELDKKIIDQIGDPLMHMVRNSVDHGLEPEDERKAAGKSPEGLLHLNAIHQGNSIVISVRDDGRGIDVDKVRKKAIEKGLLSADEAPALSKKECLQLIFRPGFSTADKVTDISGRGVGMDVVRRSIESLGGSVDMDTEPGQGTTFLIKLPLTLAIIQALLVEADKELYALPISNVSETIRITKEEIYSVQGKGNVIRLRDNVVPILNLASVVAGNKVAVKKDQSYIAILRSGNDYVGLIVDRMVNEQEIVIKSLSGGISSAPYIAGAAILGNGQVILILDTAALIDQTLISKP